MLVRLALVSSLSLAAPAVRAVGHTAVSHSPAAWQRPAAGAPASRLTTFPPSPCRRKLSNLDFKVTEDDIMELFGTIGDVIESGVNYEL